MFNCVWFYQVDSSIHVNSVDVPHSDLMATNGVIHIVKNVLYPGGKNVCCVFTCMPGCILLVWYILNVTCITYRPSCGPSGPTDPPEEAD